MAKPMPWRRRTTVVEAGDTGPAPVPPAFPFPVDPPAPEGPTQPRRRRVADAVPLLLLRAAHGKQALLTAAGVALAAAVAGRPGREVGVVFATVLVGQCILGWHNDLVDRDRDRRHDLPGKPIAQGLLDPGTAWFALLCAVLLVVPLSVATGVTAGLCYLASLAIGMVGNLALRRGLLSWLPWAASFALYPAYLSYGGWGGADTGSAPEPVMVVLAAFLGIGVHVLRAVWGLVPDNADGWRSLPLRLGLRLGASRLLTVTTIYLLLVLGGLCVAGVQVGLSR
ncbi:UbiA family prenyltransferase [Nocardioides sp. zg-DK7169]|uniref:UbiA family prenyltransferase n=1 Tax=Nocardioides sp. zg-DK7169 TaxID=2736600 RepID=UPI001554D1CC|nr:UbiA family prenyltransferase [Nocardioides sp. zg-DK7169]NPC97356.1 UbiA family prenyltransferase [Nocardioides sp. zg-DK7169]